jgi:transposase
MVQVDARDVQIAQLEKRLEAALARVAQLEEENAKLREENRRLAERLGLNSSNSSRPPSSDAPGTRRQSKKPTGRRPGGQPGHKKHGNSSPRPVWTERDKPARGRSRRG